MIEMPDKDIETLINEMVNAPIDPTIRYSVLATVALLIGMNPYDSKDLDIHKWKNTLLEKSKLAKGSKLEQFHMSYVNILSQLFTVDKGIPDYVHSHEENDLLMIRPDDTITNIKKMLDDLAKVAVYFMKANDLEELNLSNKIINKMNGVAWHFQNPRNETEGLSFKLVDESKKI